MIAKYRLGADMSSMCQVDDVRLPGIPIKQGGCPNYGQPPTDFLAQKNTISIHAKQVCLSDELSLSQTGFRRKSL